MRTTIDVKEALQDIIAELDRINKIIFDDPARLHQNYTFKNGKIHEGWTFNDAIISYVSKKLTLEWVLCVKY